MAVVIKIHSADLRANYGQHYSGLLGGGGYFFVTLLNAVKKVKLNAKQPKIDVCDANY